MIDFDRIDQPVESVLLVSFLDLANYARISRSSTDREVFDLLKDYFHRAGSAIQSAGGKVIKLIGDAMLVVFPGELADEGINCLADLKRDSDAWLKANGLPSHLQVKVHVGSAILGRNGPPGEERLDVYGNTVNTAATLKCHGIALSPEAFRSLSSESRKRFKKHTPPIRYIGVDEAHRD